MLAIAAGLLVTSTGLEAALRVARGSAPGRLASRLEGLVLLVLGLTLAAGIGVLLGGARPASLLHFVYAVVILGPLPIAASLSARWAPRRGAVAMIVAALIALVLVLRLFTTG